MPAQGNKNGLFLPRFPAFEGFVDCHPNAVCWLRRWKNTFGAGKGHRSLKDGPLIQSRCLHEPETMEVTDNGRHAMIAQAASMDRGRDEGVAQGIHQSYGSHPGDITIVPGIGSLGYTGAGLGLTADDAQIWRFAFNLTLDKGQEDAGEV